MEPWADIVRRGGTVWTDEMLKEARELGEQRIKGLADWANVPMLHATIDAYVKASMVSVL